ncbi:MAG: ribosomal L7Ae/L30e/S12e/Gadd45 family protein [Oscillospiraceae bacterium]|nr:ribosomal L7Ae/L30e/S12e/Gadd45 family protein [Oscillospiraceae bacterium]MBP3685066.1 ribosomal L7Ae/L30e/S12e/Gadd45 family protein [Oscillospiraceae bacterium]
MDKKKDCKIPNCGKLSDLSEERFVVGAKQLKKAVKAGRVRYVFLAENADPAVTEPLENLCAANHIRITWIRSMAELGRACGIEVGAAAAAVLTPDSNG